MRRESSIKAAYLYNFGKYVSWPMDVNVLPNGQERRFVIGVVGENRLNETLKTISRTKKLGGKPILVRNIRRANEYQHCHILYIPRDQPPELIQGVLRKVQGTSTLIVCDQKGLAGGAGMIHFYITENKVRFEIHPRAVDRSGLRISAKLQQLGRPAQKP